jgi:Ca2+-binding EF-hand superfamily protein
MSSTSTIRAGRRSGQQRGAPSSDLIPQKVNLSQLLLDQLKQKIVQRAGKNSLASLSRRFKIMDRGSNDHKLSPYEIHIGLKQVGLEIGKQDCTMLFNAIDTNGSGDVSFDEFVRALRGDIRNNPNRLKLVKMAFTTLNPQTGSNGERGVSSGMLFKLYDVQHNPDVKEGRKTPMQAFNEFVSMFDINGDGMITENEFISYYENNSATIDDDRYFELMIRNAWHMSGGSGVSANTSNMRVMVQFNDGSQKIITLQNDMGISRTNVRAIKNALYKQGVHEVAKFAVAE